MTYIIRGDPRTKKNSMNIVTAGRRPKPLPSKAFREYENSAGWQLTPKPQHPIDYPVNIRAVYYMQTHRRVDLVNLLEASCDILVKYKIIEDDNCNIVASHDGSCVRYDKQDPRAEITITAINPADQWRAIQKE